MTADSSRHDDAVSEAVARFKFASSSSYLILAWQSDAKTPFISSHAYFKSIAKVNPRKTKGKNIILKTYDPKNIKTTHTYVSEGRLSGFDLIPLRKYLIPGSCYHVLLQAKDDIVLIQQMAGVSVGNKRIIKLSAARSLTALVPYISATINISQLDELDEDLIRFGTNTTYTTNHTLTRSRSIITLPGKVSRSVPRFDLTDQSIASTNKSSPTGSSWSSGKATLYNTRRSSAFSVQSGETVFVDCEDSIDDIIDKEKHSLPILSPVTTSPQSRTFGPTRVLPSLPPALGPTVSLRKSKSAWTVSKDFTSKASEGKEERLASNAGWERGRNKANDSNKTLLAVKKQNEKEKTGDSDIPSYYGGSNDTGIASMKIAPMIQQRDVKETAPLFSRPAAPPIPSTDRLTLMKSNPLVNAPSPRLKSSPSLQVLKEKDDRIQPVITRSHARSQSAAEDRKSKRASRKESEILHLSSMPPYPASVESAKKKIKEMEDKGLEGESWINKRQRERSESDAQVLAVNKGWSLTLQDKPPALPSKDTQTVKHGSSTESLQNRHQSLCIEITKLQKTAAVMDAAERSKRIKWAAQEANGRDKLHPFERSKAESTERRRRDENERERNEMKFELEELLKNEREIKKMMEEKVIYKDKVEQASRQRSVQTLNDESKQREKQQQEQIKHYIDGERRAELRLRLQISVEKVLTSGIITLQSHGGMLKRRRYELHHDALHFYSDTVKSSTSIEKPRASLPIEPGMIVLIRNNFEVSQTPHSFFIKLVDKEAKTYPELMAFTDTEEEKEWLLIGLSMLSCYKLNDDVFGN